MLNYGLIKSRSNPYSQPPASQSATVPNSAMFGRTDNFPGTYALQRGPFSSIPGFNDRMSPYTSTPRVLDSTIDRPSSLVFGQPGSMYMEPMQRFGQSAADAPPFQDTDILHHPIIANGQTVKPEIQAKIHNKKFLNVDDKWTCYRRNYLAISCSFSLQPWSTGPYHLKFLDQGTELIRNFSMSISAIVNAQHEEVRELVQHTPKRDKQSERPPGRVRLQPLQPSTLGIGHGSASNGQHGFTLTSQPAGLLDYSASYSSTSQPSQPPTHHTFERIQFQKATANNGKRRAQQQYYNLVVDLYAEVASPAGSEWIKIARRVSQPMVVRGRSPGHYRDGRPDSSASMDPDGSGSNDGSVLPSVSNMPGSGLALMSYDSSQRGGGPYGRTPDYHQPMRTEQSPLSDSPHISSSSSSSAFDIGMLNDSMDPMDTIKSTSSMGSYDGGYTMTLTCPPDRRPLGAATTTTAPNGSYRHPLSSFDYDAFSRDSDGGGGSTSSSFPDTVASMVSMMPHEQSELLRNPPRLPSQHSQPSSNGGYDPTSLSNIRPGDEISSYGRFDSMQNSQGLCT